MYVPKRWLLMFGFGFLFALFALAVVWLAGQNAALEAKVDAMASANDEIGALRAELAVPVSAERPIAPVELAVMPTSASITREDLTAEEVTSICGTPSTSAAQATASSGESGGSDFIAGSGDIEVSIENPKELGNYATNSGSVLDSFFLDGGQGTVGINIYKSTLTGVNFSTPVVDGENNIQADAGNTTQGDVSGNTPSNTSTSDYGDLSISTPSTVNGTIGPDEAVGIGTSQQGDSSPASNLAGSSGGPTSTTAVLPRTVTMVESDDANEADDASARAADESVEEIEGSTTTPVEPLT